MSVVGRALLSATLRMRKSGGLRAYGKIAGALRAPREQVLAAQLASVRELLAYAERWVPYYRQTFRELGITSRDVRSLDDFAQLPVLTKDVVRERQRELLSEDPAVGPLVTFHSGGSTGVPLTFFHDPQYLDYAMATDFRTFAQAGWRPGDMTALFWGWPKGMYRMSRAEFEVRQWLRRDYQFDAFRSGPEDMDRWARTMRRLRPAIAVGYASTVARFAEHLVRTGQRMRPLKGVFTTAEKLYPPQREALEAAFGCRVYDCYGSSEVRNVAAECPAGRMHVNADGVLLEVGDPLPGSGLSPFIVTSLRSRGMPFIRYRNEDCGALVDGECDCGNGAPLVRLEIARVSDNFVLPGGHVVHGLFFTHRLYGSRGIANFQFHQTAPNHITLWVVPVPGEAAEREASIKRLLADFAALSPVPITIDVRETDHIPLSAAGKHRYTRSDVAPTEALQAVHTGRA